MRRLAFALLLVLAAAANAQDKRVDQKAAIKACSGKVNDECVVRYFKDTVEASIIRGRAVFQNYCMLCHGPEGKGDGRAARLHNPPPYNLTRSVASRDYISQIIQQ